MKAFLRATTFFRCRNRNIAFVHDLTAIPLAWLVAYWLRFNLDIIPASILKSAFTTLPLVIIIQVSSYLFLGLYRGIWRFASIPDLIRIIKAVVVGVASTTMILVVVMLPGSIPRSIFPLYALLLIMILGGSRLLYRRFKYQVKEDGNVHRVLIIGAGQAGEGLVRDMLRDVTRKYSPIAFVDDDKSKLGQEIHGIRVMGKVKDTVKIAKRYQIDLIFIALPSASSANMRRIVDLCEELKIPFRTLPGLQDLAAGRVSVNALREVSIEDLLGREQVSLDWQWINRELKNKIILVSGGGGSIGSELCRQIAKFEPSALIVLENSEINLYSLDLELRKRFPTLNLHGLLIDVTDRIAVQKTFRQYQPELVFHAAAYKHVPMLESQIRTAMQNNILGTRTLAEESVAHGVKKFVLISTDKAVNPTNVMGATKRAAEIFCQNLNAHSATRFITVRFGNVLDSVGSVVPLFRKQIAAGGPLTVTHPEITRFFMTIPEATQLILQAMCMGQGGEIFVLDMGEPIKIRYLAEQMIKLAGLKLNENITIQYIGLRPGEKLYEELFHESEKLQSTMHGKILQAHYRRWDWPVLINTLNEITNACDRYDEYVLQDLLKQLVPEYKTREVAEVIPANSLCEQKQSMSVSI